MRKAKTVGDFVAQGLNSLDDLKEALQTAIQLEFSTIPPYLCAYWSVDPSNDPDGVGQAILDIAIQEMQHFGRVCNILSAIGGTPAIATSQFLPIYPTNELPGGIFQKLAIDLKPLSKDQLLVFKQIENPEFPPVIPEPRMVPEKNPATIGEFYSLLSKKLSDPSISFLPQSNQLTKHGVSPVKSRQDAIDAVEKIKAEGEGTSSSPDQVPGDTENFAHYYIFEQFVVGKKIKVTNGKFSYTGDEIRFPKVFGFKKSPDITPEAKDFEGQLQKVLNGIQAVFSSGAGDSWFPDMLVLSQKANALISKGICPEFKFPPPSAPIRSRFAHALVKDQVPGLPLGLLSDLPGRWFGKGFNVIALPKRNEPKGFRLLLTATRELLEFNNTLSSVPNRGGPEDDAFINGLTYLQTVWDQETDEEIHKEPGLWLHVPSTHENPADSYVRQGVVPHGDSFMAQSIGATSVASGPILGPVFSTPSLEKEPIGKINDPVKAVPFLGYTDIYIHPSGVPPGIPAAAVSDPVEVLRGHIVGQKIKKTDVITISSRPTGGIINIPFVVANADVVQLDAIFWIETVEADSGKTFLQLQYVQRVIINFGDIHWPHVSVATLIKA